MSYCMIITVTNYRYTVTVCLCSTEYSFDCFCIFNCCRCSFFFFSLIFRLVSCATRYRVCILLWTLRATQLWLIHFSLFMDCTCTGKTEWHFDNTCLTTSGLRCRNEMLQRMYAYGTKLTTLPKLQTKSCVDFHISLRSFTVISWSMCFASNATRGFSAAARRANCCNSKSGIFSGPQYRSARSSVFYLGTFLRQHYWPRLGCAAPHSH